MSDHHPEVAADLLRQNGFNKEADRLLEIAHRDRVFELYASLLNGAAAIELRSFGPTGYVAEDRWAEWCKQSLKLAQIAGDIWNLRRKP